MNYGKDVIVNREAEKRCARVRDRESCLMTKLQVLRILETSK